MTGGKSTRGRRVARRLLAAALAVLVGALGALVLYQSSWQPGAALVAWVFNRNQLVTPPPGFSQVARTVTVRRVVIPTPDAPAAHLDIYRPNGPAGAPRPVIMWVHGGFISSSAATVANYAILLAHAGYTVASLDYSLAPGHRYPVPVRQGNAALGYLRANAADPGWSRYVAMGGSFAAGPGIAPRAPASPALLGRFEVLGGDAGQGDAGVDTQLLERVPEVPADGMGGNE